MSQRKKEWGITDPMSLEPPTDEDIAMTEKLRRSLEPFGVFESDAEKGHRTRVISVMNDLVKEWIQEVVASKSSVDAQDAGGTIRTFGSFRLGVNNRSGDIDLLVVAPITVTREDFFDSFAEKLRVRDDVKEFNVVPEAYVPAIKLVFMDTDLDLLFAQLSQTSVPDDIDLTDIDLLRSLDDKSVRSVNGCRVTDSLLSLVPDKETFRLAVRCIKLWAKRRGIYGNVYGYPGGVAWAIMVSRVCQFYPFAAPAVIIEKFFFTYVKWKFGSEYPISLCPTEGHPHGWRLSTNPWNQRDNEADLMPVLTTSYPAINACHNVVPATMERLRSEWRRGFELCPLILAGMSKWEQLWEPVNLFLEFKQFVQITARTSTVAEMNGFEGLVQSTLRVFVSNFPREFHAVPFPKVYDIPREDKEGDPYRKAFFFGVRRVSPSDGYTDLNIFDFFEQFKMQVDRKMKGSPQLDPERCYCEPIQTYVRKNLPGFLFPDGKPPKKAKKSGGKKAAKAAMKPAASAATSAATTAASAASAAVTAPAAMGLDNSSQDKTSTPSSEVAQAREEDTDGSLKRKRNDDVESVEMKKVKQVSVSAAVDDELELNLSPQVAAAPISPGPTAGVPKLRLAPPS